MYEVLNCFGTLVRNVLEVGKLQTKGKDANAQPPQCPRIEIDQRDGAINDDLSDEQALLARELVRRAIFIEMEPGLSMHGNVTTLRWHLRRIFLPAFNAALGKTMP